MKNQERYRLFLETINTLIFLAGVAFISWWLWQILPMKQHPIMSSWNCQKAS